jgi:site-specific DNA recombinase
MTPSPVGPGAAQTPDRALSAGVYARVSTDEQAEHGTSLASQVERCRAYAIAQGWVVADELIDEGISGAAASRPALDRLLSAVREGQIDIVIVAKLDRLGRSMRYLSALLGELDDRGVRLVSVAEAFDSATASGRLQRNILGSFAEFEREQIRERTHSGLAAVARQGYWPGGPAPFGWRITPAPDAPHRVVLMLDEAESETLRVAVDAVMRENLSTGEVAGRLNALGHRPRRAPRWRSSMVRDLLRNLPLSGQWSWRRGQDNSGRRRQGDGPPIVQSVPAIIDQPTHERLLAIMADRSTGKRAAMRHRPYLLSRRFTSPHGVSMQGVPGHGTRRVYVCRDALPASPERCGCRRVDADSIEAIVWDEVVAVLSDPHRLIALAGAALGLGPGQRAAEERQMRALDRKIRRTEERLSDHVVELLTKGTDQTAVQQAVTKVDRELAEDRRRRSRMAAWQEANRHSADRARRLLEMANEAVAAIDGADDTTRRRTLDLLDVRVAVQQWVRCPTCEGKGLLRSVEPAEFEARRRGRRRGETEDLRRHPKVCPNCRRSRWVPRIVITGLVPLDAGDEAEIAGVPFELGQVVAGP